MKKIEFKIVPVQKKSMVDQVESNLRDYIKQRGFKPGDNLPTENELAISMNVSRNVVREALSRFKMLGLIESNKKNGIKLIKFDLFPALERVLDPSVLEEETLQELVELRIMLEIGMAKTLFRKKTPEGIQTLRKIIADYLTTNNEKNKIAHEISFHSALYKMTGNETLIGFQKYLKIVFDYVVEAALKAKMPESKIDHTDLVDCLEKGSAEEFRQKMQEHFSLYSKLDL